MLVQKMVVKHPVKVLCKTSQHKNNCITILWYPKWNYFYRKTKLVQQHSTQVSDHKWTALNPGVNMHQNALW